MQKYPEFTQYEPWVSTGETCSIPNTMVGQFTYLSLDRPPSNTIAVLIPPSTVDGISQARLMPWNRCFGGLSIRVTNPRLSYRILPARFSPQWGHCRSYPPQSTAGLSVCIKRHVDCTNSLFIQHINKLLASALTHQHETPSFFLRHSRTGFGRFCGPRCPRCPRS